VSEATYYRARVAALVRAGADGSVLRAARHELAAANVRRAVDKQRAVRKHERDAEDFREFAAIDQAACAERITASVTRAEADLEAAGISEREADFPAAGQSPRAGPRPVTSARTPAGAAWAGIGPRRSRPRGSASTRSRKPPDQPEAVPATQEGQPRGLWKPPANRPVSRAIVISRR
jgi:hypothetical protein